MVPSLQAQGVTVQAYRSLGQGKHLSDPVVVAIAAEVGKTAAQVLGRWCVQKNIVYIPKSEKVRPARTPGRRRAVPANARAASVPRSTGCCQLLQLYCGWSHIAGRSRFLHR